MSKKKLFTALFTLVIAGFLLLGFLVMIEKPVEARAPACEAFFGACMAGADWSTMW